MPEGRVSRAAVSMIVRLVANGAYPHEESSVVLCDLSGSKIFTEPARASG
jgi:hypothetical protein